MGKGDKKSRRGKINAGSYGKRRPRKASKPVASSETKAKS
jgi:ribosomal small subunit protein bTHX